uniref:Uncharacterized protein n=1 Tax=Clastoptera arizonana TaxID=38151 RepID=A0A1B6CXS8_9HEMI
MVFRLKMPVIVKSTCCGLCSLKRGCIILELIHMAGSVVFLILAPFGISTTRSAFTTYFLLRIAVECIEMLFGLILIVAVIGSVPELIVCWLFTNISLECVQILLCVFDAINTESMKVKIAEPILRGIDL